MSFNNFDVVSISIAAAFSAFGVSSCTPIVTPQERPEVIERLQQAKQTDLHNALDSSLGPIAQGDYLVQADQVDSVIKDLNQRSNVPQSEVSDALFVPPKHISPELRARLIQKLEQARDLDDEKWHNNLGSEDEAWLTLLCEIQSRQATRVIKKLETGEPVSWWEINDAMSTPDEIP